MEQLFSTIGDSLAGSIAEVYLQFNALAPSILAGLVVFLMGVVLAVIAERLLLLVAHKIGLETLAHHIGLKHFLQKMGRKNDPLEEVMRGLRHALKYDQVEKLFVTPQTRHERQGQNLTG